MEGLQFFRLDSFANAKAEFSKNDVLEPVNMPLDELRIAQYRYTTSWKLLFQVNSDSLPDATIKEYKTKFTNMLPRSEKWTVSRIALEYGRNENNLLTYQLAIEFSY